MNDHDEGRRVCLGCLDPITGSANIKSGERRHFSRGLCSTCYSRARTKGELDDYPTLQNDRNKLVAAFIVARKKYPGISQGAVAQQLGIPRSTLTVNLQRAMESGDDRIVRKNGVLHVAE